jgi:hypothetical protein
MTSVAPAARLRDGRPAVAARRRLIGIALMCGALLCFSGLDATAKWLNHSLDPMLVVWARYVASVAFVSVLINPWTVPGCCAPGGRGCRPRAR